MSLNFLGLEPMWENLSSLSGIFLLAIIASGIVSLVLFLNCVTVPIIEFCQYGNCRWLKNKTVKKINRFCIHIGTVCILGPIIYLLLWATTDCWNFLMGVLSVLYMVFCVCFCLGAILGIVLWLIVGIISLIDWFLNR